MRNDFNYNSQDGFTQIHAVEWIPEGTVTGVIQICHGMAEYIDRYSEFAEYMSSKGYYVVGNDHLGHGKSVRSEKYLGHFQEYKGNSFVIGDIRTLQELSLEKYPGVPYIMMGHSMGSFLVRQYLTMYGEDVSGAIIMGTGHQSAATLTFARILCKIIASFKGWRYQSPMIDNMAFGSYNKKFQPEKTGVEWLSANEENCLRYKADPLCGFKFTLGGFNQMFAGMETLNKKDQLENMPKDIPVLLISGAEDPVGDFGKNVKKVYRQYRELGLRDVTIRLYPGDRHEILKEDNRETVMDDILGWLYGSRENLADEKFPKAKGLELKSISPKENLHKSPLTPEMIISEIEETEEEPAVKRPAAIKHEIKLPEMPVVKPTVKAVATEPVNIVPGIRKDDVVRSDAKPAEEEEKPITEFYKFSEPMVFVDMNAQRGLTPLVSVDEDGKTESDILAERLAAIMSGTYVFEDERRAEEEAKAAAEAQEKAAREAAAIAARLKEAPDGEMEAEKENEKKASVTEAPAETAPANANLTVGSSAESEKPEKPEKPVKEEKKPEPKKVKKIRYVSEEDELLAFIEKLEAEKIANGEPLAVYTPEVSEDESEAESKETKEEESAVKAGPILASLANTKPVAVDLEAKREAELGDTKIIDLNQIGDVLDEISSDQKKSEIDEPEYEEPEQEPAEAEEITPEDVPTDDTYVEDELNSRFGDTDNFMLDLSAELDALEDIEEEELDEDDFEEEELDEDDFPIEILNESDL